MHLYAVEDGECCHPSVKYVIADSKDEAIKVSGFEDSDFAYIIDVEITGDLTPRIVGKN